MTIRQTLRLDERYPAYLSVRFPSDYDASGLFPLFQARDAPNPLGVLHFEAQEADPLEFFGDAYFVYHDTRNEWTLKILEPGTDMLPTFCYYEAAFFDLSDLDSPVIRLTGLAYRRPFEEVATYPTPA